MYSNFQPNHSTLYWPKALGEHGEEVLLGERCEVPIDKEHANNHQ